MRISDWSSDVCSSDLHVAVEARAAGRIGHPGLAGRRLALAQIAAIIDLVPRHDPDVRRLLVRRRHRLPMRHRERLNPFYPHRIVDVAEFVDVGGGRGEGQAEPAHGAAAPIASGEVFTNQPPSSASERASMVYGKRVYGRVDIGGGRLPKKTK